MANQRTKLKFLSKVKFYREIATRNFEIVLKGRCRYFPLEKENNFY
jgi:hypothetical protein